jgi:tRNA-splicing ligase RtcB
MVQVFQPATGGLVKAWTDGVPFEDAARQQVANMAAMPFVHKHVAVMPDVHGGIGATVGSVVPMKKAIIPAAVGVDIGCGMIAQRTSLMASDLPDNLFGLRSEIEARIPHGRTTDSKGKYDVWNDRGSWGQPSNEIERVYSEMHASPIVMQLRHRYPRLQRAFDNGVHQLGTLGGGNHFVEVCLDKEDRVWVMLHSGSRGVGNSIGSQFIEMAKNEMERWHIKLVDKDLAYLPEGTDLFNDYWKALNWAQWYARKNRELMMNSAMAALSYAVPKPFTCDCEAVNCHHNYAAKEHHFGEQVYVTRKGAVKIGPDELGIIPGSMGARSFIVRGKKGEGLANSFCSCSHGAGRVMSRTQAKATFTLEDHIRDTAGIECRKDADVIDETPKAYKDIDAVMAAQADHVEVLHELHQVVCVKG